MPFLPANQQRQSTEGNNYGEHNIIKFNTTDQVPHQPAYQPVLTAVYQVNLD